MILFGNRNSKVKRNDYTRSTIFLSYCPTRAITSRSAKHDVKASSHANFYFVLGYNLLHHYSGNKHSALFQREK